MTFLDKSTNEVMTLSRIRSDYLLLRAEDPLNHAETFKAELFMILMDTVNGRNDCRICGMTPDEICRYVNSLRSAIQC